jgi:hypothetical protein
MWQSFVVLRCVFGGEFFFLILEKKIGQLGQNAPGGPPALRGSSPAKPQIRLATYTLVASESSH